MKKKDKEKENKEEGVGEEEKEKKGRKETNIKATLQTSQCGGPHASLAPLQVVGLECSLKGES